MVSTLVSIYYGRLQNSTPKYSAFHEEFEYFVKNFKTSKLHLRTTLVQSDPVNPVSHWHTPSNPQVPLPLQVVVATQKANC